MVVATKKKFALTALNRGMKFQHAPTQQCVTTVKKITKLAILLVQKMQNNKELQTSSLKKKLSYVEALKYMNVNNNNVFPLLVGNRNIKNEGYNDSEIELLRKELRELKNLMVSKDKTISDLIESVNTLKQVNQQQKELIEQYVPQNGLQQQMNTSQHLLTATQSSISQQINNTYATITKSSTSKQSSPILNTKDNSIAAKTDSINIKKKKKKTKTSKASVQLSSDDDTRNLKKPCTETFSSEMELE